jgi:hypothetical protein
MKSDKSIITHEGAAKIDCEFILSHPNKGLISSQLTSDEFWKA